MKLAHIDPQPWNRELSEGHTGYHLVLAQKLLQETAYREWYRNQAGRGLFIIVDNGAAENDTPPFSEVVDVANYIFADEIVMPDVVNDMDATLQALADLPTSIWDRVPLTKRFMVPQGKTYVEWRECLHAMTQSCQFATVGVSKYHPSSRLTLLHYLTSNYPEYNVHVLGAQTNPVDELTAIIHAFPGVRGYDTGAAVAWAQEGRMITSGEPRCSLVWDAPIKDNLTSYNMQRLNSVVQRAMLLSSIASHWPSGQ